VPETASNERVAIKRLDAKAAALRRLLEVDVASVRAAVEHCHGR
jgi:hypothetical protein